MQKYKFSYDKENDDLLVYHPKSKSKGSIEIGDLVLDFNNKKEFVGIQIMNASQVIKDLLENKNGIKPLLKNLKECKIDIKNKNNLLIIKLYLISDNTEVTPIISIPKINESSPALAYT